MHIGFCGPATLSLLQDLLDSPVCIKGYPFRGSSILVREYIRQGHQVTVFTTSPDISSVKVYSGPRLKVVAVPTRSRGPRRAFDFFAKERSELVSCILGERPDVLHANWTYEFGLASQASGIPTLITVHDWAPKVARANRHPYWYFRLMMQVRCITVQSSLTAPSEYLARRVRNVYRKKCTVIPNGLDTQAFESSAPSNSSRYMRVGMLNAGFSDLKNVKRAFEAWSKVHESFPEAILAVAGPGYEPGGEAHRWAAQNSLLARVEFLGGVAPENVPQFFASLDAFLHPSQEESFGMVLIEAMASGVPVIAGKCSGAVPEVTGGNAVLTDINSVDNIAASLRAVMSDASLRRKLSVDGKQWSRRFDVEAVGKLYVGQLTKLLA